jgi:hypothetical protein
MGQMLNPPPGGTSKRFRHDGRVDVLDTAARLVDERPLVLLALALALLAVAWPVAWRWTRTVVTIAHEGGHAVVAVLAGRGLTGIRLHADTSGLTVSTGARRGPGLVATFLGGYPAPPLLGLGGAVLVAADLAAPMLWIALVLLVATLVHVRNVFGAVSVLATGALVAGSPGGAASGCRTGSPPRWRGSWCSAACRRCASCGAGGAAPGAPRTPTRWPPSPGCPPECGRRCSG